MDVTSTANKPKTAVLTRLWIGILAGPLAWATDEVVGYTATAHECSTGSSLLLHSLTVGALLTCGIGFLCARSTWTASLDSANDRSERVRSMALSGLALSVAFAVVILATAIPKWILSPCD
ncbi:MAG TPA: hypothetical protein VLK33_22370 [Terriglobales bacterium]|nr:hypothetical protein [Terriglobales bacterium]